MQRYYRRLFWLVPLAAAGVMCSFPTDKSDQVIVLIQGSSGVVIRGKQLPLVARAFRVSGTDTIDLPNVSYLWSSGNATLATVQDVGGGHAEVTGVNSGNVEIRARAIAHEQSDAGYMQVRVSSALEVDSVRPSVVRFGDTVTVYGVGVDSIFLASLGNVTLLDYPIPFLLSTRSRDSLGFARATFWVPPPARSARLSYIGPGVFGEAPESTMVLPMDVLEPNETAPRQIDLDGLPRFPLVPALLFYNPALAFELLKRDELGVEWYRFSQTTTRDLTLVLGGPGVRGTFSTFVTDSLAVNPADTSFIIGPESWTLGPGSNYCSRMAFEPLQVVPESTIIALHDMPPGALHSISVYTQAGHYALRVNAGYPVTVPTILRDDHEEDDFCSAAGALTVVTSVPSTPPWRDTLTIDNPQDVDWIRFHVTPPTLGPPRRVTLKVAALGGANDSSDVDLYLLNVPGGGSPLERARAVGLGSNELITQSLPEGDYYAVVVDYVGRPVRYGICIEEAQFPFGNGCTSFPAPPAPPAASGPASKAARAAAPGVRLRPAVRH